jgi:hypothetical protein
VPAALPNCAAAVCGEMPHEIAPSDHALSIRGNGDTADRELLDLQIAH